MDQQLLYIYNIIVIVDEAHHYPAPTWKLLVDHFGGSNHLFLTATPEHNGEAILDFDPCYQLSRGDGVGRRIVRPVRFDQVPCKFNSMESRCAGIIIEGSRSKVDKYNPKSSMGNCLKCPEM